MLPLSPSLKTLVPLNAAVGSGSADVPFDQYGLRLEHRFRFIQSFCAVHLLQHELPACHDASPTSIENFISPVWSNLEFL